MPGHDPPTESRRLDSPPNLASTSILSSSLTMLPQNTIGYNSQRCSNYRCCLLSKVREQVEYRSSGSYVELPYLLA